MNWNALLFDTPFLTRVLSTLVLIPLGETLEN
jgi:hypothetical protein